jgi:hypothetical protein
MTGITISAVDPANLDSLKILNLELFNQLSHGILFRSRMRRISDVGLFDLLESLCCLGIATQLLHHARSIALDATCVYLHSNDDHLTAPPLSRKERFLSRRTCSERSTV